MRIVARVAAETAMLLGIPAQVEGNLIRVSTGLVGVNEACSGIRSLQTALMIGLLFGELKRLSILRRVALVAGAIAIALFANFVRAVFLVQVAATENISEVSRWHDIAGYTIIALVFVGTMGLAYWLGGKQSQHVDRRRSPAKIRNRRRHGCLYSFRFVSDRSSLLASVCRDRDCGMVSHSRTQSCQREHLGVCVGPSSRRTFVSSRSTQKFAVSSVSTRARRRHGR